MNINFAWKRMIAVVLIALMAFQSNFISAFAKGEVQADVKTEERITFAREKGWEDQVDTEGYLQMKFFTQYTQAELAEINREDGSIEFLANPNGYTFTENFLARAATSYVSHYHKHTGANGGIVGYFEVIDGVTGYQGVAFCSEHNKTTPPAGTTLTNGGEVNNAGIRKAVYYYQQGTPGCTDFALVSLAISAYNGNSSPGPQTRALMSRLDGLANPPSNFKVYWLRTANSGQQDLVYGMTVIQNGRLSIQKTSANPGATSGNSNYSLEGARYGVWKNAACTEGTGMDIRTNASGYGVSGELPAGTYYVKELDAPKGYVLDSTVYAATVTANQTNVIQMNAGGKHSEVPKYGKIELTKVSGNPSCTDQNPNYSLQGAEYSVYKDAACTQHYGKMVTDGNGHAELNNLPLNKYWIKETKSSKGYAIDKTVYPVDISKSDGSITTVKVKSTEIPLLDPVSILLKKVDAETEKGEAQSTGSLEGAEFEVKFYTDLMDTDPAESGKMPIRQWIMRTDADGFTMLDEAYKVSGDDFWYNPDGNPSLPYGTITFKEIKAPNGYLLNEKIIVKEINEEVMGEIVYQEPIQKEKIFTLTLTKLHNGTEKGIPGAVFTHTRPDGSKEDYTTDADGKLHIKGLQWGEHTVLESNVPDGYSLNKNPLTFTVGKDNTVTVTSKAVETDMDGNMMLETEADGNLKATVFEKPAPFDLMIHKVNDHDLALADAEFTLYEDEDCKKMVSRADTDAEGNLTFDKLIPEKVYFLKETKAPEGYQIPINEDGSAIVWKIKVKSVPVDDVFEFHVNDNAYTSGDGQFHVTGTKAEKAVHMTILNEVGVKLPETGGNGTLILVGAGSALVLACIFLSRKYKKNERGN